MPTIKCKMCGGSMNVEQFVKTVNCDFCGTDQTVPLLDNERILTLFNRANTQRMRNEYDSAIATYQTILIDNPNNAEAHYGIVLCKFGIEYVDDPKTGKKIPTCHRTIYESIFDDEDYKKAIENADVVSRQIYTNEAKEIDRIQKEIISISQTEEPYDIFICYKETDELGNRTKDSVLAEDIYEELTYKGYKVFFARITLESKLGSAYEPIIFAALNSAKVMLAIGTKEEYINAPWVKNEWSRYMALMEKERGKYLIPCYLDMDPYDLPEMFKNLQAQDMSKIGAMQDLSRGVDKLCGHREFTPRQTSPVNARIDNMLKRTFMLIEDGDFEKADEVSDEILNEDVECAEAYLAKLLIEYKLKKEADIQNLSVVLNYNKNYEKILKYGDESLRNRIKEYNKIIRDKNYSNTQSNTSYNNNKKIKYEDNKTSNGVKFSDNYEPIDMTKHSKTFIIGVFLWIVAWPIGLIYTIIKLPSIIKKKK